MTIKTILLSFALAGIISNFSCSKKTIINPETPVVTAPLPAAYSITEDFESGTKGGYAIDSIQLNTGKWTFSDALIGNLATDAKSGAKSVRIRTGYLGMNFDIAGLSKIYIKHAKFGSDANSTWQLLMSTDGGKTYNQLGSDITESQTVLVTDSFSVAATASASSDLPVALMPSAMTCTAA